MNREKLKLDFSSKDWIRCQSKSHTGRFYMFNKATGETKWCTSDADGTAAKSEDSSSKNNDKVAAPPKVITAKLIRTPAQDRLKRLQSNLNKDIKELKEKSPKKDRYKNSQHMPSTTRSAAANKVKQAFTTEQMLIPIPTATSSKSATASASHSKIATASASKTTTAIATPSKTMTEGTASDSKTAAITSSKTSTALPSKTTTVTPLKPTTTAVNDPDIVETNSLREETPKLSYYGRRLRQSSDTRSLEQTSAAKQNSEKSSVSPKKSPNKPVAENPDDKQIVEKPNSPKSSRFEQGKKSAHLKRRSIRKSLRKSPKRRRLVPQKYVRFNPANGTNISLRNNPADDGSSDEAANTSDATKNPELKVGIIDKIKAICKKTFRMSSVPNTITKSPLKVLKSPTNLGLTTSLSELHTACKAFRDCNEKEEITNDQPAEDTDSPAISDNLILLPAARSTSPPPKTAAECNTPNNLVVPAYPRGSANTRLERLRQSLFLQPSSSSKIFTTDTSSPCGNTIDLSESYNYKNNNNSNNACEPMDWQSIEDFPKSSSIELVSTNNSSNKKPEVDNNHDAPNKSNVGTVSEYYDSVNANLLRFSAEQQDRIKWSSQKWLTDHYYFVIDTNVLLQNLTFIDDLIEMKLCDTNGTIIYIPYCVLQELDKLKMRSSSESAKTLTVRAIKYLNKKFEELNKHIHAQSAIDERDHLIDVISADDSILNCCLHVRRHVENVVLLTEDVNLRNKAICNNLLVTTKSDLISKHAEPSSSTSPSIWQQDARK